MSQSISFYLEKSVVHPALNETSDGSKLDLNEDPFLKLEDDAPDDLMESEEVLTKIE